MRSLSSKSSLFLALGLLGLTTACGETKSGVDGGLDVTQPSGGDVTQPSGEDVTQPSGEDVTQSPDDVHQPDVHQPDVHQPVLTTHKSCKDVFHADNKAKDGLFPILNDKGIEVQVYCDMTPKKTATPANGAEQAGWTLILATRAYDSTVDTKDYAGVLAIKEGTPEPTKPGYLPVDLVKHLAAAAKQVMISSLGKEEDYVVSSSALADKGKYTSPLGNLANGTRMDMTKDKYTDGETNDMKAWFVGPFQQYMAVGNRRTGQGDNGWLSYPHMYWAEGNTKGLHLNGNRSAWGNVEWKNNSAEDVKNNVALGVYVR